jgi:hypothetical protein
MPRTWNVPARNPGFTGRDSLLVTVRERLLSGDAAVVQALRGMGGVGKTQLTMEYAHRFAGMYDLAWWIDAEQAELIGDQFAALGTRLGCVTPGAMADVVRAAVLEELRDRGRYLLIFDNAEQARGQARTAHDLAAGLRQAWRDRLGDDDRLALAAANYLAWALKDLGRYAEARDLNQDTHDRYRRVLGNDHPSTLNSANGLAIDLRLLGDHQAARDLDQDTLDRRRHVLGDDHPDTLTSASKLATDLHMLGELGDH